MKIAHISILPMFTSGIFKKIGEKADIAKKNDLDIDFYLLNPDKEYLADNIFIIKKSYGFIPTHFLRKFTFRLFKLTNVMKLIPLDNYDAIILRYPLVDGIANKTFTDKYGHKTITEHHSNEIAELFALGRPVDIIRSYFEKKYSKKFLSKIAGIIAVTDEIRNIQLSKINTYLPSTVIANGINIDTVVQTGFIPFNEKILKIIFVASVFSPWHGLERILYILKNYHGDTNIELYLVGTLNKIQINLIIAVNNDNITIIRKGKLYNEELNNLMGSMNLAISSLSLSKNNMKEACPLKSREYIARGIPFIYAYEDVDLDGTELFAKKFNENHITMTEILQFAKEVSVNSHSVSNQMQQYSVNISWQYKLLLMKKFIVEILHK